MSGGHCFAQKTEAAPDWSTTPEAKARFGLIAPSSQSSPLQKKVTALPKPKPSDSNWMEQDPMVQRAKAQLAQAKCSECGKKKKVQQQESGAVQGSASVGQIAASGFQGSPQKLPHLASIERSFSRPMGHVQAYVGGAAAKACYALGAEAYASGNQIAFKRSPDKALVGHEAAHVVQQASGKVQLSGGVGRVGDQYEQNADAVGENVARGQSAAHLLKEYSSTSDITTRSKSETQLASTKRILPLQKSKNHSSSQQQSEKSKDEEPAWRENLSRVVNWLRQLYGDTSESVNNWFNDVQDFLNDAANRTLEDLANLVRELEQHYPDLDRLTDPLRKIVETSPQGRRKWGCTGVRCAVKGPPHCDNQGFVIGESLFRYDSEAAACAAAKRNANSKVPPGCHAKHCNCHNRCHQQ